MRTRRTSLAWLAAVVLTATACGGRTPTSPDDVNSAILTGTWTGDIDESYGGRGTLRLTIEQTRFALGGTFRIDFENAARSRSGSLSGNVDAPPLSQRMQLSSSGGFDCAAGQSPQSFAQLTWTESGNRMTGTYAGFGCLGAFTGTFDIRRQ